MRVMHRGFGHDHYRGWAVSPFLDGAGLPEHQIDLDSPFQRTFTVASHCLGQLRANCSRLHKGRGEDFPIRTFQNSNFAFPDCLSGVRHGVPHDEALHRNPFDPGYTFLKSHPKSANLWSHGLITGTPVCLK